AVKREKDGTIKLRVEVDTGDQGRNNPFGRAVRFRVVVNKNGKMIVADNEAVSAADLALVDDKGKPFRLVTRENRANLNGRVVNVEIHLVFQPQKDQGRPARLVYSGRQKTTIKVPFTLRNVPLP